MLCIEPTLAHGAACSPLDAPGVVLCKMSSSGMQPRSRTSQKSDTFSVLVTLAELTRAVALFIGARRSPALRNVLSVLPLRQIHLSSRVHISGRPHRPAHLQLVSRSHAVAARNNKAPWNARRSVPNDNPRSSSRVAHG